MRKFIAALILLCYATQVWAGGFGQGGFEYVQSQPNPLQCSLPLLSTDSNGKPTLAKGVGPVTYQRASKQLITDHEGQLRPVYDGCAAVEGSRFVSNIILQSNNLQSVLWSTVGVTKGSGNTLNFTAAVDRVFQPIPGAVSSDNKLQPGHSIRITANFPATDAGKIVRLGAYTTSWNYGADIVIPASGTISRLYLATSPVLHTGLINGSGGAAISVTPNWLQLEIVTSQTNQAPGEYIPTTTAPVTQCFAYANPYTVDGATGVVTDSGTRTLLPAIKGVLFEPASTNKCANYSVIPGDTLGSELITNAADRDFSSDTGFWTKNGGWTISGGTANATNEGNSLVRGTTLLTVGKVYEVTYTIVSISAGNFTVKVGQTAGTTRTSAGTYTERLVCSTDGLLRFQQAGINFTGSIDNVSVKEVTWGIGTKSFYSGSFIQNIPGLTLSGDTAAVLSVVDDTAALQAAGLYATTGAKVYKLDNSAGVSGASVSIAGTVANTNPHSALVYTRGGDGWVRINSSGGVTSTNSAQYTKKQHENIVPSATSRTIWVDAVAGSTVYFILNQLEEQPFATSPIIVQGGTAARAATVLSMPTAGNFTDAQGSLYCEFQVSSLAPTSQPLIGAAPGPLYINSSYIKTYDFTTSSSSTSLMTINTLFKAAAKWQTGGNKINIHGGVIRATSAYDGSYNLPANIQIGPTIGNIKNLRIYRRPLSDAQLIQMTQ